MSHESWPERIDEEAVVTIGYAGVDELSSVQRRLLRALAAHEGARLVRFPRGQWMVVAPCVKTCGSCGRPEGGEAFGVTTIRVLERKGLLRPAGRLKDEDVSFYSGETEYAERDDRVLTDRHQRGDEG